MDTTLSMLDKFSMLVGWYIFWWTEKRLEEDCQNDRIQSQRQKYTQLGMNIIDLKWKSLKDDYSSYTDQVRTLCCHETVN